MTTPAQNPSAALVGGKPESSLSSLVLNCLTSNRLAVAAWLALFLLAARLDAADYRLSVARMEPHRGAIRGNAALPGASPGLRPPRGFIRATGFRQAHTVRHFTNTGI